MRAIYIARLRGIPEEEATKVIALPAEPSGSICALQANRNMRCCFSCALWLSLRQTCWLILRDLVAFCPFQQVSLQMPRVGINIFFPFHVFSLSSHIQVFCSIVYPDNNFLFLFSTN